MWCYLMYHEVDDRRRCITTETFELFLGLFVCITTPNRFFGGQYFYQYGKLVDISRDQIIIKNRNGRPVHLERKFIISIRNARERGR